MKLVHATVSQGNIDNNHLYVTAFLKVSGFLPQDFADGTGEIEIEVPSLDRTFKTERWRNRFRNRQFPRAFYRFHNVKEGEQVILEKVSDRHFRLLPTKDSVPDVSPQPVVPPAPVPVVIINPDANQAFRLEKHLEDFIAHNWKRIEAFKEWDLMSVQYETATGPIDMLAKHKTRTNAYLVVELKRDQSSDTAIGQICRYMGWVEAHLAGEGGKVEGIVVAHEQDDKIRYAVRQTRDVSLVAYAIDFSLKPVSAK